LRKTLREDENFTPSFRRFIQVLTPRAAMTPNDSEPNIVIRHQTIEDRAEVWVVNTAAFGRPQEAELVEALQQRDAILCSLVAEVENRVVGHILFAPGTIRMDAGELPVATLGPMAVLPDFQGQGIGSRLVREGLHSMRALGHDIAIVLGHPDFYARFGFKPAQPLGIRWEHDAPEAAFMVTELTPGALAGVRGTVYYQPEFSLV
jgi:putative acetyltransferase